MFQIYEGWWRSNELPTCTKFTVSIWSVMWSILFKGKFFFFQVLYYKIFGKKKEFPWHNNFSFSMESRKTSSLLQLRLDFVKCLLVDLCSLITICRGVASTSDPTLFGKNLIRSPIVVAWYRMLASYWSFYINMIVVLWSVWCFRESIWYSMGKMNCMTISRIWWGICMNF